MEWQGNCERESTCARGLLWHDDVPSQDSRRLAPVRHVVFIALALTFAGVSVARSIAQIEICQTGCLCIYWSPAVGDDWYEVRCEAGTGTWVTVPLPVPDPLPDGPGSFLGDGQPDPPPVNPPCTPLMGSNLQGYNQAKALAESKLTRVKVGGPQSGITAGTTCTVLFRNSPLPLSGLDLLKNYVVPRYGGGGCNPEGGAVNQCTASGASMWTTTNHNRIVYVCDSFFTMTTSQRAHKIIHELLHVAGQTEDQTTSTGPGDAPTPTLIDQLVTAACQNPQVIPND